jgi:hypothetical protein
MYIEVEGEMVNFLIFDGDNVCHPNPMFGHEWQVYQRGKEVIKDPATGEFIGLNTPITFSFSTGTFIAVPGNVAAGGSFSILGPNRRTGQMAQLKFGGIHGVFGSPAAPLFQPF